MVMKMLQEIISRCWLYRPKNDCQGMPWEGTYGKNIKKVGNQVMHSREGRSVAADGALPVVRT